MGRQRRLRLAAIVAFIAAYAGLSHYGNSLATTHDLAIGLALGPISVVGLLLIWRWIHPGVAVLGAAAAALLMRHFWPLLDRNFSVVYLLEEGGFYSVMAATFGRSLFAGREALCTRLADQVHGPLTSQEVRYTRSVTAAWTLFFALIAAAMVALYLFAPLRTWSLFANFCVMPLIGLMFVAEYAVRQRVLPQDPRRGLFAALRVYFASPP